jgi:hypothetical protein
MVPFSVTPANFSVTPAKAGAQFLFSVWTPAFAGVTWGA